MSTAILVDGGYFVKRFRAIEPHNSYNATRASELAFRWSLAHLKQENGKRRCDLYRIFFYDCPPIEKKMQNPISKVTIDFSRSKEAVFRREMHAKLRHMRKVALRLGHLSEATSWAVKPQPLEMILKGKKERADLVGDDLYPNVRQKGVDMRIGIDISSLALKRQVDQIILIAGDADFVPAAKLARREGVDFILDPMWNSIPSGLIEHIDGMRSVCPKPQKIRPAAPVPDIAQAPISDLFPNNN